MAWAPLGAPPAAPPAAQQYYQPPAQQMGAPMFPMMARAMHMGFPMVPQQQAANMMMTVMPQFCWPAGGINYNNHGQQQPRDQKRVHSM